MIEKDKKPLSTLSELRAKARGERRPKPLPAVPEKFFLLLKQDEEIRDIWAGNRPDLEDQSRNGFYMSMAEMLVNRGYTNSEILTIFWEMPSGWGKRTSNTYLMRVISKPRNEWFQELFKRMLKEIAAENDDDDSTVGRLVEMLGGPKT